MPKNNNDNKKISSVTGAKNVNDNKKYVEYDINPKKPLFYAIVFIVIKIY